MGQNRWNEFLTWSNDDIAEKKMYNQDKEELKQVKRAYEIIQPGYAFRKKLEPFMNYFYAALGVMELISIIIMPFMAPIIASMFAIYAISYKKDCLLSLAISATTLVVLSLIGIILSVKSGDTLSLYWYIPFVISFSFLEWFLLALILNKRKAKKLAIAHIQSPEYKALKEEYCAEGEALEKENNSND